MSIQLRQLAASLALGGAALLSACGGGSDSDAGGNVDAGGDNSNGGGSSVVVPAAVVDRFVGTFATPCVVNEAFQQVSTGKPVQMVTTLAFTKVSDTLLRLTQRDTFYASSDVECKGASIGTANKNSPGNTVQFGASVQANLGAQVVEAYRVDGNVDAIGGLSSGTSVVINDLRYPGDYFIEAYDFKELLALSVDGSKLYTGDLDTEDANGYPAKLDATFFFTRQP